jgi:hypothetical protein
MELSVLIEPTATDGYRAELPVWPDDPFTRDWLDGIATARAAADIGNSWDEAEGDAP